MKRVCQYCYENLGNSGFCSKCKKFTLLPDEAESDNIIYRVNKEGGMTAVYNCSFYSGDRTSAPVIPAYLCGRPVTEIMTHFFSSPYPETLPDTVKRIGRFVFSRSRMKTIKLPAGLEELGDNAFEQSRELEELILPDTLKRVGRGLCAWSYKLTSVKLPEKAEYIGCYAFAYCYLLKNINIPETVNFIGRFAFYNCSSIEEINVPDGVEFIADGTFSCCTSLKRVTLGKGLKRIGRAFMGCTSLHRLDIPDSVGKITYRAFDQCAGLKITYRGKTYTEDRFTELYNDFENIKDPDPRIRSYKYPIHYSAITNRDDHPFDETEDDDGAVPGCPLTVYRNNVTPDALPAYFSRCFLPEDMYSSDDIILAAAKVNGWHYNNDSPYAENDNWTDSKGRLRTELVRQQARLLKKYLGLDIQFCYSRTGRLSGYYIWQYGWGSRIEPFEFTYYPKKMDQPNIGYFCAEIESGVPELIQEFNKMIKEYLVWCYERRTDPYFYNIIPLYSGDGKSFEVSCHSDLGALVTTEKMKKARNEERNYSKMIITAARLSLAENADNISIIYNPPNTRVGRTMFEDLSAEVRSEIKTKCPLNFHKVLSGHINSIVSFRIIADARGRICPSVESVDYYIQGSAPEKIKLYDGRTEVPDTDSFNWFCMLPAGIIKRLLKECISALGIDRGSYKAVLPFPKEDSAGGEKKYGVKCVFRIKMKNGEPDLTGLSEYVRNNGLIF